MSTVESPTGPDPSDGPSQFEQANSRREVVFDVLSNARRRQVVHYLLQRGEDQVTLRELSRQIAAWENDIDREVVDTTQRKRVYTALRQSHLPTLARNGFVDYDDDRSIVRPTEKVADLRVYLEVVPGKEMPWSVYYTGLGLLLVSVTVAKLAGVFPFGEVPAVIWTAIFAALVTGSGLAHVLKQREMRLGSDGPPPSGR